PQERPRREGAQEGSRRQVPGARGQAGGRARICCVWNAALARRRAWVLAGCGCGGACVAWELVLDLDLARRQPCTKTRTRTRPAPRPQTLFQELRIKPVVAVSEVLVRDHQRAVPTDRDGTPLGI